jgi:hypothetical protein
MAGSRRVAASVDRSFKPADELVDLGLVGLGITGRRHQSTAQLPHGRFEGFGLGGHGLRTHTLENDAAGKLRGIMAIRAIALEHAPMLFTLVRKKSRTQTDNRNDCERTRGY